MKILFPMAGKGNRLKQFSSLPKPLTKIGDKTLAELSVSSLGLLGTYVFVVRDFTEFENGIALTDELIALLKSLKPNSEIIRLSQETDGAARTALMAKDLINTDEPLVITNCDQITRWKPEEFLKHVTNTGCDGCVTVYPHKGIVLGEKSPFSFIELDYEGFGTRLTEKFAISPFALNGIHYWKHGSLFVSSSEEMIAGNIKMSGEFYISGTYNFLISKGMKVNIFPMKEKEFYAIGNVDEIQTYLNEVQ